MLDYTSLAAVAAVVREGSFERAAGGLGVTPSAVSQRIRALEERLGVVLVIRGQPCRATEVGAKLCAHVERVCLLEGEMAAILPDLVGEALQGRPLLLRIAVNSDSLATWFMPAAAAFAERSGASLDLLLDDEAYTADRLRSGEVLAAVTTDVVPVQGCRTLPLGSLTYIATASPAFARRWFPEGVGTASLAVAPLLRFDRRDDLQARWARKFTEASLASAPTHWIPATQGCIDAARAGLGWGMAPAQLVGVALDEGQLVDLAPGSTLEVPLYWQHARLGARLLMGLTRDIEAAAQANLKQQTSDIDFG